MDKKEEKPPVVKFVGINDQLSAYNHLFKELGISIP